MKFIMTTVEIDGKTVDAVKEWGDVIYWAPGDEYSFQVHNGRRVAGTSFQAFGADCNRASESESRWVAAARAWWEEHKRYLT